MYAYIHAHATAACTSKAVEGHIPLSVQTEVERDLDSCK